jgi:hypothetical protein
MITAIYKWRKKSGAAGPVIINKTFQSNARSEYPSKQASEGSEVVLA